MSFDFLDGIRTNGQRNPKSIIEQKHHTAKEINIVVLGMRGTGKTGNLSSTQQFIDVDVGILWFNAAIPSRFVSYFINFYFLTFGTVTPYNIAVFK